MMLPNESDTGTYEGRLNVLFALVGNSVHRSTTAELAEAVPWVATSHEIRAKLMALRSRDCVFYDAEDRTWYR